MAWISKSGYDFEDPTLASKFREYYYELTGITTNRFVQKGASKDESHFFRGEMLYYIMRKLLMFSGDPSVHLQYRSEGLNLSREEAVNTDFLDQASDSPLREYDWPRSEPQPLRISLTLLKRNQSTARDIIETFYTARGWTTPAIAKTLQLSLIKDSHQYLKIFLNPDNNYIKVFSNRVIENADFRQLMVTLPLLFPNINNEHTTAWAQAVIDNNMELIINTLKNDLETLEQLKADKMYRDLEKRLKDNAQKETAELARQIERQQRVIEDGYNSVRAAEADLRNMQIRHLGLTTSPVTFDDSVINFLKHNPNVHMLDCSDRYLSLRIQTPLFNYVQKDIEMYYKHSNVTNIVTSNPAIAWLFKEAFIEHKYRLMITQDVSIPWNSSRDFKTSMDPDRTLQFPNPHLWHYTCFSSTKNAVIKAMQSNNVILAINQLIAGVGQITFTDHTVISRMVDDLADDFYECLCWQNVETGEIASLKTLWEAHNAAV